jgi:lipopolysaccharide export system permease protein
LKDGVFQHPAQGVTLYIREILPTGELLDTYVADRREKQTSVTHTAQTAYVLKEREDTVLVMKDGYIQNYEHATNTLSVTKFDDMTYNFGADAFDTTLDHLAISQVETTTILFDPEAAQKISKRDAAFVNEELHKRLFNPTLAFAAALVGFASIYVAGFSRFGVGRFVLFAIFLLVVMKMIESGLTGPTRTVYELWPLIYAPSAFGILASIFMLFYSQRPRKVAPPDIGGEPA